MSKVVVTGMGMITAIGNDVAENLDSLKNRKHGVGPLTHLETSLRENLPAAEIKFSNDELAAMAGIKNSEAFTPHCITGADRSTAGL